MVVNINQLINLRGHREQFHKFFAHNFKGGMKNIHCKGCEVNIPLHFAFGSNEIQNELLYERIKMGEEGPELTPSLLIENVSFS